jgi:general nucleoside transport system permease protein
VQTVVFSEVLEILDVEGGKRELQSILSTLNTPIQSNLLLMAPYIVTIIVLAGLVGKVRGPKAEGIPYIKA